MNSSPDNKITGRLLRLLPLMLMLAAVIWFLVTLPDLSIDAILSYTPPEPLRAALFLMLAFALKSMTVFFPLLVLFAVSGRLFPLPLALLINLAGLFLSLNLPYLIGLATGKDVTQKLQDRYPKLQQLRALRHENNFFFSFLIRALGILPCDVVSLYFGNTRMPYLPYITGAMLGFLPELVCGTVMGMQLKDVSSPGFWITVGVKLLLCVVSFLLYRAYAKKYRLD